MSNTRKEIASIIGEIVELRKVYEHLGQIEVDFAATSKELSGLSKKVDKESDDVKNLENTTLRSVFSKVLGNQEEQLEKERQEYLEILLLYNEKKKELELIEYEKELLDKKTSSLSQLENKLEALKNNREKEILKSHSSVAQELLQIAKKTDNNNFLKREVQEAHKVGQSLLLILNKILEYLSQAIKWGHYDMAGRGSRANYAKRQSIDRANAYVHEAHRHIQHYQKELKDVGLKVNITLKTENFNSFLDFFFDNLISDWIVQKKIKNTVNQVQATRNQVLELNNSLEGELNKIEQAMEALEKQRSYVLENN